MNSDKTTDISQFRYRDAGICSQSLTAPLFFPGCGIDPDTGYVIAAGAAPDSGSIAAANAAPDGGNIDAASAAPDGGSIDAAGAAQGTGFTSDCPETAVNIEPLRVYAGSTLHWPDKEAACGVFFYGTEPKEEWMHTFCYEPESNWAPFEKELPVCAGDGGDLVFDRDGFIRLVIRLRPAEKEVTASRQQEEEKTLAPQFECEKGLALRQQKEEKTLAPQRPAWADSYVLCQAETEKAFELKHPDAALLRQEQIRPYFREEAERVCERLAAVREPGDLVFFLLADTHYAINGGWEETAKNVAFTAQACRPDFAVHLGDLTDGLLPAAVTKQYSGRILETLCEAAGTVYCCLGNHDSNYAGGNPERFTKEEMIAWYLGGKSAPRAEEYYAVDDEERRLRLVFLASFDCERETENERYGYSEEECAWLRDTLAATPAGYGVLVFSHVPLLPEMHVWSNGIRGSRDVLQILEEFQEKRHALLAFFHGHNHCDQIERTHAFPIISVGCGKLESFPEKKPEGAVCYERQRNTVTQELWDVVRVSSDHRTIDLLRFGAGEDRRLKS